MINYTEKPYLQCESKEIMSALQDEYGVDKILETDDKLVLIGEDWCYKSNNGLQLVEKRLAFKLCIKLAQNNCGN